jgi:hypothetical protein
MLNLIDQTVFGFTEVSADYFVIIRSAGEVDQTANLPIIVWKVTQVLCHILTVLSWVSTDGQMKEI